MSRKWVWAVLAVVVVLVALGLIGHYASPSPSSAAPPSSIPPPTTTTVVVNGTIRYFIEPGWYACNVTVYYDSARRLVILYTWLTMPKDLWLRFIGNTTAWSIEYAWPYKSPKGVLVWKVWILVGGAVMNGEELRYYNYNVTAWVAAMNGTNVWSGVIVGPVYKAPSSLPSEGKVMLIWATLSTLSHNYWVSMINICPYKLKLANYGGYMGYMPIVTGIFDAPLPPQFADATGYKVVGDLPGK